MIYRRDSKNDISPIHVDMCLGQVCAHFDPIPVNPKLINIYRYGLIHVDEGVKD